jgi:hypothetical protein
MLNHGDMRMRVRHRMVLGVQRLVLLSKVSYGSLHGLLNGRTF